MENAVKLAKADIVPTETNLLSEYDSFAQVEAACAAFTAEINARVHRATGRLPVEMLTAERPALHPIPDLPHTAVPGPDLTPGPNPVAATLHGQFLLATYRQFPCPPTGSFRCPLINRYEPLTKVTWLRFCNTRALFGEACGAIATKEGTDLDLSLPFTVDRFRWTLMSRRNWVRRITRRRLGLPQMSARTALRNLVDIADTFESRGSTYSLAFGTLLGAVRDGDFIAHDHDTDMEVPVEDFDPRIIRDLVEKGFRLMRSYGYPSDGMELTLGRGGVQNDLFFVYPRDNQTYVSAYRYDLANNCGTAEWYDYESPALDYDWLTFKGHRFRAPADPESILAHQYGASWRVPIKTWRTLDDPPNCTLRAERLNFNESRIAIDEFLRREGGLRVYKNPYCLPPEVRTANIAALGLDFSG